VFVKTETAKIRTSSIEEHETKPHHPATQRFGATNADADKGIAYKDHDYLACFSTR
jgi:hypothetical protein